jgi:hypothetical protein
VIDVTNEHLISFSEAARHPAFKNSVTGRAAHISSIFRYAQRGARSVTGALIQLESVRTPTLKTSSEAIERFIHALSGLEMPRSVSRRTRERQVDRACAELVGAKLL